ALPSGLGNALNKFGSFRPTHFIGSFRPTHFIGSFRPPLLYPQVTHPKRSIRQGSSMRPYSPNVVVPHAGARYFTIPVPHVGEVVKMRLDFMPCMIKYILNSE